MRHRGQTHRRALSLVALVAALPAPRAWAQWPPHEVVWGTGGPKAPPARGASATVDDDPKRDHSGTTPSAFSGPPFAVWEAIARVAADLPRLRALGAAPSGGYPWMLDADDDPKLDHSSAAARRMPPPAVSLEPSPEGHEAPAAKLALRRFTAPNLDGSSLPFEAGVLSLYPVSIPGLRIGVEAEVGHASGSLGTTSSSAWYFMTGASLGVQYPAAVTPFLEGHFIAGLMGGDVAGRAALSWGYMGGLEGGIEVYLSGSTYASVAIGWLHPYYRGIDYAAAMAHPDTDPPARDFSSDVWTMKVGLGF